MITIKFVTPSWDDIYLDSLALAARIRRNEKVPFDTLVGISRGGLVLCRILSDLLDIQDLRILKCEYYTDVGETSKRPLISQEPQGQFRGKNVLVVDDVSDSGKSLVAITDYLKQKKSNKLRIVTLYMKPKSSQIPDYFARKTEAWIIFPWELYEAIKLLSRGKMKTSLLKAGMPRKYMKTILKMSNLDQPRKRV